MIILQFVQFVTEFVGGSTLMMLKHQIFPNYFLQTIKVVKSSKGFEYFICGLNYIHPIYKMDVFFFYTQSNAAHTIYVLEIE